MKEHELIEVNNELERITDRVNNIEKVANTIENLAQHGIDSWDKYLKQKDEQEIRNAELAQLKHQREIELEDKVHKRSMLILGSCILVVFVLIFVAMLKDQAELVKIILGSSLAIAGGAGVANLFKNSGARPNRND